MTNVGGSGCSETFWKPDYPEKTLEAQQRTNHNSYLHEFIIISIIISIIKEIEGLCIIFSNDRYIVIFIQNAISVCNFYTYILHFILCLQSTLDYTGCVSSYLYSIWQYVDKNKIVVLEM